jgi:ABC-type branched-subunit amino acid transport system permease subunit
MEEERKMKKIILVIFIFVLLINLVFAFLLNRSGLLSLNDVIALLLGSYVVYGILNLYLYIQIKIKNNLGYNLTLIIGFGVSVIAFVALAFNLKNDKVIFFPMMYVFSMFCTFLNWIIADKAEL